MHTQLLNLKELNSQLQVCSVDADKLARLGFHPQDTKALKKEHFPDEVWRKYRAAKLYLRSQLPEIKAALARELTADLK